jgi:hypothetical protein
MHGSLFTLLPLAARVIRASKRLRAVDVKTAECFAPSHDVHVVALRWRDSDNFVVRVDIPVTYADRKGATSIWWSSAPSFIAGAQRFVWCVCPFFSSLRRLTPQPLQGERQDLLSRWLLRRIG